MNQLSPKLSKKTAPATIGFRLEQTAGKLLADRARSLGVSVHELARHYVLLILSESQERSEIHQSTERLFFEIRELRKDVALSSETLLVSAGKADRKEAHEWVVKSLCSQ